MKTSLITTKICAVILALSMMIAGPLVTFAEDPKPAPYVTLPEGLYFALDMNWVDIERGQSNVYLALNVINESREAVRFPWEQFQIDCSLEGNTNGAIHIDRYPVFNPHSSYVVGKEVISVPDAMRDWPALQGECIIWNSDLRIQYDAVGQLIRPAVPSRVDDRLEDIYLNTTLTSRLVQEFTSEWYRFRDESLNFLRDIRYFLMDVRGKISGILLRVEATRKAVMGE